MEYFSTAAGDRIRVVCESAGRSFSGDVSLAVSRDSDAGRTHGVLTSGAHADAIHALFAAGDEFRIVVEPAGESEATTYESCVLLSSSGKWITAR